MVKKTLVYLMIVLFFVLLGSVFAAESAPKGIFITKSSNGRYSLERKLTPEDFGGAVLLTPGDFVSAQCTFKDNDRVVWSKRLLAYPAIISISNNGEVIVFANCESSYAAKSVSFYNKDGELVKEVYFNKVKYDNRKPVLQKISEKGCFYLSPIMLCRAKCGLVNVNETAISSDGTYYILAGRYDADKIKLFFYDVKSTRLLWAKEYSLSNIKTIRISPDNNFILVASYDPEPSFSHNMVFLILDTKGTVKWEKQIQSSYADNHKIDYASFVDNGKSFKIFSGVEGKYLFFVIDKNGGVSETSKGAA